MSIGPVQLLVVSFDEPRFDGEIIEVLSRLRENNVIRLIDALAVTNDLAGELRALRWSDLSVEEDQDLGATVRALLGLELAGEEGTVTGLGAVADAHLVDESEVWDVADQIPRGGAAALALIEHVWAQPLRDAISRAGGVPVSDTWVHPQDLVEIGLQAADDPAPE